MEEEKKVPPPILNAPYNSDQGFVGREEELKLLHELLVSGSPKVQAISGLGGMGKTRLAFEYAKRFQDEYRTVIWLNAGSNETLISDIEKIANQLRLQEKDAKNQNQLVQGFTHWLEENPRWLIILDGFDEFAVDEHSLARDFLSARKNGQILVTTRSRVVETIVPSTNINILSRKEGATLLLRRAGIIGPSDQLTQVSMANQARAEAISYVLDGLPLALELAGAYIVQTGYSLSDFLNLYQTSLQELLIKPGNSSANHTKIVAMIMTLSLEKIQQASIAAVELLQFCALLYPSAIPEEIVTEGAPYLGPVLQAIAADPSGPNTIIRELMNFSFISYQENSRAFAVHDLLHDALKDKMDKDIQHQWAERAVLAINQAFPEPDFMTWHRCQRYLPHAQACLTHIEQWNMKFPEAVRLLSHAGYYLWERGQYEATEQFYKLLLIIREQELGPDHPDLVNNLNNLARVYHMVGKYSEAEPLYQKALVFRTNAIQVLENYADLLRKTKQETKLVELEARIKAIKDSQGFFLQ